MLQFARRAAVIATFLALPACNTIQGLGADLEAGGRAMTRAAARTEADMQVQPQNVPEQATTLAGPLTPVQARARALSLRPGAIESEEITGAGGEGPVQFVFQIRGEDGGLYAVAVDAQTGAASEARL